jgi:FkbM family methyltransferase
MILSIKIFIAKWLCGIVPYKCINGRWCLLPFGVSRAFWPWKRHSVEPYELDAIKRYGPSGGVYLDIGANAGLLTLAMRDWAGPSARIYAVEPNPHTYELLGKVMALNRVNPAGLWALAISDSCGTVKFQVSQRDSLGVMSSLKANDPDGSEVEVPCMSLDALCQQWDRLDYIKVDVEGAEILVLTGARATLNRLRPVVQVEVHGPFLGAFGHTVAELFKFMDECGYIAINAVTSDETTSVAFSADSGLDAKHPITRGNMRHSGYGHVVFRPKADKSTVGDA